MSQVPLALEYHDAARLDEAGWGAPTQALAEDLLIIAAVGPANGQDMMTLAPT